MKGNVKTEVHHSKENIKKIKISKVNTESA